MAYDYTQDIKAWRRALCRVYARATAEQIQAGGEWYANAAAVLAAFLDVWTGTQAAAVCAVLSPRVAWKENITGVRKMHKAARERLRVCPTVAGTRRNVERAWTIAQAGDTSLVSGPKVSSFYANLCGDYNRVTIDIWAARAAGVSDSVMSHLDRRRYTALVTAYRLAAMDCGHTPAQFQAIVWTVTRGNHE
jgi:hypothetical protein